ncbi:MAG TPA: 16S rRNA (adenine(1518)-N(6)/adenine(1519)-N(6))-dimethyltransferase RsmA [Candidatus Acidoferrum sp.]|nr:16S rRNA (adenine(1518)-N(6)/adenine(1519)-N(6))-dimethyltransferase RsmA [Candidatus Acidoferrum sp.]
MSPYRAKKRFGQHFLTSKSVISRMIELIAPGPELTVLEIGPGRGVLTLPLTQSGAKIVAVEFDRDLIGHVKRAVIGYENVKVINADFVSFDPDSEGLTKFALVGNLPYNITTPVIDWCVRYRDRIQYAVFMVQREMAARLAATPGHKDWSPLGIFTQLFFDIERCFDVSARSFSPPPKVVSAVIRLTPRASDLQVDWSSFESLVRASFRHRRKLLINNLVPDIVPSDEFAIALLGSIGIPKNCRAEQVTIEQFDQLAIAIADERKSW